MAAGGAIVLVCLALAWRASVRLVAAHGRAHVLETEARHWRDLSQAAAGLAHETRNPLGLIRGWTQRLAESDAHDPEREQHARAVIEECDRVTARINQFLAFAKPHKPSPEPVDVASLLDELAVILQPDLEAKEVELGREMSCGCTVQADRELLRQALFNLVQNAIHFSPEGSAVGIQVDCRQNGGCRVAVSDRGPGVPEEAADSLFSPYFSTRPGGTGLGLAIVKHIAQAHQGRATVQSAPGEGSTFTIHLPAAQG
jgi:signal transduction histidine kinase